MNAPTAVLSERALGIFNENFRRICRNTDRMFGLLMAFQFVGGVIAASLISPRTYAGSQNWIHPHVLTAFLLGGTIAFPIIILTFLRSGAPSTRYAVAVGQMLMSGLLIHISGGRIETHFHVFGSLAFLAFYRDWRLLIPATVVVLIDHVVRGIYLPQSVYGVTMGAEWRFLEHAGWVVFENVILTASCVRAVREMKTIADRQAQLEDVNAEVERQVRERTAELARSEIRKGAVLEHALDGIITLDSEGRILEFNPAAEAMFDISREHAIGMCLAKLLNSEDSEEVIRTEIDRYLTSGETAGMNRRQQIMAATEADGTFPLEIALTPIQLEDSTIFTAFVRDMSEQRRLESKLAHAQKMESIGQLAAGIAHEINTPNQYIGDNIQFLTEAFDGVHQALQTYGDLRKEASASMDAEILAKADEAIAATDLQFLLKETPKALAQAQEGVERVGSIVRAMKEFSHPGVDSWTAVDINRIVESTLTVARNEWKYVAIVDLDLAKDLPLIQGHPGELGQVLLNLIVNAAHAIIERYQGTAVGRIRIATHAAEGNVEIVLTDDGCGIPEDVQSRIFDPFFTTKGVGLGTGQGLALSHSVVVDRHGGELTFESNRTSGTVFTIRLPLTQAAKDLEAA